MRLHNIFLSISSASFVLLFLLGFLHSLFSYLFSSDTCVCKLGYQSVVNMLSDMQVKADALSMDLKLNQDRQTQHLLKVGNDHVNIV